MLGLNWGGQIYPWESARVIATIVVGAVAVIAFIIYEAFAPPREPYIPLHLFRNRQYNGAVATMTASAMAYYGFSIVWPSMIATLYPSSPANPGWKAEAASGLYCLGSLAGLGCASFIRQTKWLLVGATVLGTAFAGAAAVATQHNEGTTVAMMTLGNFFQGICESVALTATGIAVNDQNEIGIAVGIGAAIRSLGGAVASTFFSTILTSRLKETIPALVPGALLQAGLPESSIPTFLEAMQGLAPLTSVTGLTPAILTIGTDAYRTAVSQAYRTIFLANLCWCGLGVIGAFFCPNVDKKTENYVAQNLHEKKEERRLEEEDLDPVH